MSKRLDGKLHQPPWVWFAYNITFKEYDWGGYATENGAKRRVASLNKCMGGVWEVHTREQLVAAKHPVEGASRDFLLYEIGVRVEPVKYPPVPQHVIDQTMDRMFPIVRASYPKIEGVRPCTE